MEENQDTKSTENQDPVTRLGDYAIDGGPGRPKGLKNKYTMIKEDMLCVWEEENGKEKFRQLFNGSRKDFIKALEKIIALFPKDSKIDLEGDKGLFNLVNIVRYGWEDPTRGQDVGTVKQKNT